MEKLISQLVASGMTQSAAAEAIKQAARMPPVDGAISLKNSGAEYHIAFQFLSAPYIEATEDAARMEAEREHSQSSPVVLGLLGFGLIALGIFGPSQLHVDPTTGTNGGTQIFIRIFWVGVATCMVAMYRWMRR